MPADRIDPEFRALPLAALADAALSRARELGAQHADLRVERIVSQSIDLRDGTVTGVADTITVGLAVRVVVDGAWGFASHVELTPARAAATAERAVAVARTLAPVAIERVERADEPVHADAVWVSDYTVDPFTVPTREKVELLTEWSQRLLASDGVDHVQAGVAQVRENKFYADTAGTTTTQQRVRIGPSVTATAVNRAAGGFETMSSPRAARRAGAGSTWPATAGTGTASSPQLPELLAEKAKAPSVQAGAYDLVIDPTNLWLTIHESVGHATEYDRAIGYEAAYAGTSFATPDGLGTLRYGSRAHARHRRPDGRSTASRPSASTTTASPRASGISCATAYWSATSSTGRSRRGWDSTAPTAAPSPTPRTTCRSSGWPTCRCVPIPRTTPAPRS